MPYPCRRPPPARSSIPPSRSRLRSSVRATPPALAAATSSSTAAFRPATSCRIPGGPRAQYPRPCTQVGGQPPRRPTMCRRSPRRPPRLLLTEAVPLDRDPAMASAGSVTRATCRQRDRSVIAMSSGSPTARCSRNTVHGGGSSTTFSNALAAPSVSRSASSMTTICQPRAGTARAIDRLVDSDRQSSGTTDGRPGACSHRSSVQNPAPAASGSPSPVHCRAAAKPEDAAAGNGPAWWSGDETRRVIDPTSPP